jgi:hypothetical protein
VLLGLPVALLLAGLGAVVGVAVVGLHQRWALLLLGIAACAAVMAALPPRWSTRPAYAAGLAVVVAVAATPRAEGDYLVGSDPQGYTLLGLALALVLGSVLSLARRPAAEPAGPPGS